jgi:hypothetical protein
MKLETQISNYFQTFFSTDIVKYQNQVSGGAGNVSFSATALSRWLQLTIPLTAITLVVSWISYKYSQRKKEVNSLAHRKVKEHSWWQLFRLFSPEKKPLLPLHQPNDEGKKSAQVGTVSRARSIFSSKSSTWTTM